MLLRIYQASLRLYPDSYQARYNKQILQTMHDVLKNEPSAMRRHWYVLKEITTNPLNALEQYVIVFSKQKHVTPKTLISLIALGLLVPFFIALSVDEVAEFATGDHLYNTWLWSRGVLITWIAVLPFISLVIALSVYIISLIRQKKKRSPFAKRYWLLIGTIFLSASILFLVVFHSGARCWITNSSPDAIVNCTQKSILRSDSH